MPLSEFMDDTFTNVNFNDVAEEPSLPQDSPVNVLHILGMWIKLAICTGSAGACAMLIIVIVRFKELREKGHVYILHYSICSLLNQLSAPVYETCHDLVAHHISGASFLCMVWQFNDSTTMGFLLFATAIGMDWYLMEDDSKKYRKYQQYAIITVWMVVVINFAVFSNRCFGSSTPLSNQILIVLYTAMLVLIAKINFSVRKKVATEEQLKLKYLLKISTCVVASWLLLPLYYIYSTFIEELYDLPSHVTFFVSVVNYVSECLVHSVPILITHYLGKKNRAFKIAYAISLRSNVKNCEEEQLLDACMKKEKASQCQKVNQKV